jgi:hypothetical protein
MSNCEYEACRNEYEIICECEGYTTKICELHLNDHLRLQRQHNFKKTSIRLAGDQKMVIKACLIESIRRLRERRLQFQQISNQCIKHITSIVTDTFAEVHQIMLLYHETIERIDKDDKFDHTNHREVDSFVLKYLEKPEKIFMDLEVKMAEVMHRFDKIRSYEEQMNHEIESWKRAMSENFSQIKNSTFSKIKASEEQIKIQFSDMEQRINLIGESIGLLSDYYGKDLVSFDYPAREMHIFNGTKAVCTVNAFGNVDKRMVFDITEVLSAFAGFCYLDESHMFYYGGDQGLGDYAYVLDFKSGTAQKRTSSKGKSYTGCCANIDDEVFVFGGYIINAYYTPDCEKYSLSMDKWTKIASMPDVSANNSILSVKDSILIAGYLNLNLLSYSIANDIFLKHGQFNHGSCKVLIDFNSTIFVLEYGKTFKSNDYSLEVFELINENNGFPNEYLLCSPVRCGKGIYFVLNDSKIYRFCLEELKVSLIRKLNIP